MILVRGFNAPVGRYIIQHILRTPLGQLRQDSRNQLLTTMQSTENHELGRKKMKLQLVQIPDAGKCRGSVSNFFREAGKKTGIRFDKRRFP